MPTNVLMPQMGESIAEGTIVRWVKRVGDHVDRDEPLFEISTDKVDAEIPSPAAGLLTEIRSKEGETIPVNQVVAVIDDAPGATVVAQGQAGPVARAVPPEAVAVASAPAASAATAGAPAPDAPALRQKSSPLVRRIAAEHGVDISQLPGSGIGGRVTKHDILGYIDNKEEAAPPPAVPGVRPGARDEVVPLSIMRRRIAEHMIASRRTSAHVHSVFEIDFTRVSKIRDAKKAEFEQAGAKLTYLPFIVKAVVDGLRAVPVINSSIDGENIIYHKDINIGIAVALDWGLIVPVVRQADEKSILGLSRAMHDLASRARSKQLKPEEVQGGTFTITNPGVFGALFGTPIISQPQVAILGIGAVEKRPVVVDDAIAIRPRAYLALGYDHRLIDGAVADQFMSVVKQQIENFDAASL
ncbi:MAG TPA: dihydrolipoamide acetyltransferase family protein [Vicinamibacterales bacterium]|jgi:2-oxoglutarate dehydrogenase E2 component (dihydrolipoamide succinyltransferase)